VHMTSDSVTRVESRFFGDSDLRLPDVLERQELSLNLLSKLVMSLILEKNLLSMNIFRRS